VSCSEAADAEEVEEAAEAAERRRWRRGAWTVIVMVTLLLSPTTSSTNSETFQGPGPGAVVEQVALVGSPGPAQVALPSRSQLY
jgi:hypothetical protein